MKKDYLKPELYIADLEAEDLICELISGSMTDEEIQDGDVGSKDRGDFEGEGDSGWGALW